MIIYIIAIVIIKIKTIYGASMGHIPRPRYPRMGIARGFFAIWAGQLLMKIFPEKIANSKKGLKIINSKEINI